MTDPPTKPNSLKALVIYDDFNCAAKANMMLQRAAQNADKALNWNVKPWRVDVLRLPPGADDALIDAVDAHLIVFAGCRSQSLPSWLRDWLEQWVACREVKDAALAMIDRQGDDAPSTSATPALFQFAARHGLGFIAEGKTAGKDGWASHFRSILESDRPSASVQQFFPDTTDYNAHRHWGLNE